MKSYLSDSQALLDDLKPRRFPPNAKLFTADAISMYDNIDTEHAIKVISWLLDQLASILPYDFPIEAVKFVMRVIMTTNVFQFGVLYFLQLLGTAMGTSAAVMWATLYFAYHEHHCLLRKYDRQLLFYKRYIDDVIAIWLGDSTAWTSLCADFNNFGKLKWDVNKPSSSVDFLDLTLTLVDRVVESKTFQKKLNLYLYIPPASAHPSSCIKGTVYGLVGRYFAHNTHRKDYVHFVALLYARLLERNWDEAYIKPLIFKACESNESRSREPPPSVPQDASRDKKRLFVHLQYHRDDVPRARIRQLFEQHLGETLKSELGIECPTIAYARPKTIGA